MKAFFSWTLVTILVVPVIVFLAAVGGAAFGALGGIVVNWFFHDTMQEAMAAIGMTPIALWKLGAFLGFVGGFFKSYLGSKSND